MPKQPNIEEFKQWCRANQGLAMTVCKARAYADVTRKKVDRYIQPIFDTFDFRVSETISDRRGTPSERIQTPRDLYLCLDDQRVNQFFAECDAEHRRQGYTDIKTGQCPALLAEHLVIEAQNALLDAGKALFGIEGFHITLADRAKFLEILIGGCFAEKKKSIQNRFRKEPHGTTDNQLA